MKQPKLTKKQKFLLDYISNFIAENGFSPSYREIAADLDYKSLGTIAEHINNLIIMGYLRKSDSKARSIELVTNFDTKIDLIDQIKTRYNQLDKLEKNKVTQAFIILNIDQLDEIIK